MLQQVLGICRLWALAVKVLLPSGANAAETLARWTGGCCPVFQTHMTCIDGGDASGISQPGVVDQVAGGASRGRVEP